MAVPIGTTSRQVQWLARWSLAGVMILGMLAWWWPGYRSWGSAVGALTLVLGLWLAAKIVDGDRTVPGHLFHLAVLAPAGILTFHLARHALAPGHHRAGAIAGGLDISMIYWLSLLSLGVMLTQDLLPLAARHTAVLGAAGAAMMLGPAVAIVAGPTEPVRTALALLAFAGVGVWLAMLWRLGPDEADQEPGEVPQGPRSRLSVVACVVVAVAAVAALSMAAPLQALLVAGIVATALLAGALVFPARRVWLLLAGGALAVAVVSALTLLRWVRAALAELIATTTDAAFLGSGEQAFGGVSPADSGLSVLMGTVGWVGTVWLIGGVGLCILWMLLGARRGSGADQGRAIVWSCSAGCATAALIAPGGLFIPATALAASFVLGLLPVMLGRPRRARSGLLLLSGVGVMLVLLGLAPHAGLFRWSLGEVGRSDAVLHAAIGFLLAVLMAWQMGRRRIWLGLAGIALAALLGGPGEIMQMLFSERTAERRDWIHHAMGSAVAVAPYLLCMLARWCESRDARTPASRLAYEAHLK